MRRSVTNAARDLKVLGRLSVVPGLFASTIALLFFCFGILSISDSRPVPVRRFATVCSGVVAVLLFWLAMKVRNGATDTIRCAALVCSLAVLLLPVWWRYADESGMYGMATVLLTAYLPVLTVSNWWALNVARRLQARFTERLSRPHATRRLSLPRDARALRAVIPALLGGGNVLLALLGGIALAPVLRQQSLSASFRMFMPGAFEKFRRVRAVLALRAQEVRLHDCRLPVLLLRSFADDDLPIERTASFLKNVTKAKLALEEQIVAQLWEVGPVVAIGQPGLENDPIGAARERIVGPLWQTRVQELIEECALVVVVLGETEGLFWEYEQLSRSRVPVLAVWPPGDTDVLTRRWHRFTAAYPPARSIVVEVASELPLLVWFRTQHEPLIMTGHPRDERSYELAFALWRQNHD